jgi:hypothetical protein
LDGYFTFSRTGFKLSDVSPDDLRWLCLVAGPALLNELGKEAGHERAAD